MSKHLYFRTSSGQWEIMIPKNFNLLLREIKERSVVAITAEGITKDEKEVIKREGFSLCPGKLEIRKKNNNQIFDILEIR